MTAAIVSLLALLSPAQSVDIQVDLSNVDAASPFMVSRADDSLSLTWPVGANRTGQLVLALDPTVPRLRQLRLLQGDQQLANFEWLDPSYRATVGTRQAPGGRPPEMSPFNVFFDNPAKRPHEPHSSRLQLRSVRVVTSATRARVVLDRLECGPFAGSLEVALYAGEPLVHIEAVVSTDRPLTAYVYEAGLDRSPSPFDAETWPVAWQDTEGLFRRQSFKKRTALAVRSRALAIWAAEGEGKGGIALFPPPHAFFYPRDATDNQATVFVDTTENDRPTHRYGIRQTLEGGGAYVPWYNAPPGTRQRWGMFLLLDPAGPEAALTSAVRYTNGDRFLDLPGHQKLATHFHMAIAMAAIEAKREGRDPGSPEFVRMFKDMGVDQLMLAEFHGDGHPRDPGPLRLPELDAMFSECRRLSDEKLLIIPGEEANAYLGLPSPGRDAGHYMCAFPTPVHWTMVRGEGQPFVEDDPGRGKVYHVGSSADMLRLLEAENGLAWTSHPRIKASSWTPDIFRNEDFYRSDRWLGAAWKAMPADLSDIRLGVRALDLLDDMSNWGPSKSMLGEVDVFKLNHTHELYAHMNVNYLRLDRTPRFDEGWAPVLDALRKGAFFVSTGEVLIPEFTVGHQPSGETAPAGSAIAPEVRFTLAWTFPLEAAALVWGDGQRVHRHAIEVHDTRPFDRRTWEVSPSVASARWMRLEAWDVAGNGAFTMPVWLTPASK